jgi:hypothetical protein
MRVTLDSFNKAIDYYFHIPTKDEKWKAGDIARIASWILLGGAVIGGLAWLIGHGAAGIRNLYGRITKGAVDGCRVEGAGVVKQLKTSKPVNEEEKLRSELKRLTEEKDFIVKLILKDPVLAKEGAELLASDGLVASLPDKEDYGLDQTDPYERVALLEIELSRIEFQRRELDKFLDRHEDFKAQIIQQLDRRASGQIGLH